jgi:hypothetical protein
MRLDLPLQSSAEETLGATVTSNFDVPMFAVYFLKHTALLEQDLLLLCTAPHVFEFTVSPIPRQAVYLTGVVSLPVRRNKLLRSLSHTRVIEIGALV